LPKPPFHIRVIRNLLRRLNYHLGASAVAVPREPFDPEKLARAESALRALPLADATVREYFEKHIARLARTLALAPEPQRTWRALELGCYMQITPLLERLCGYREVRGAYLGEAGRMDRKTVQFPDGEFVCEIDHFDAERDPFPYPNEYFDLVIAGEIIEHLAHDPMHLLIECRRVLAEGGYLIVTTPNVGSVTSVAKSLEGRSNPQIFVLYDRPNPNQTAELGHVREYTTYELGETVRAAGFEIVQLFTTYISEFAIHLPLLRFLEVNGFSTENRGEQSWCLARKRSDLPEDRFPRWLYSD
jgi:SAM-dependent methyltransferase